MMAPEQVADGVFTAVSPVAALLDEAAFPADERAASELPPRSAAEYLAARTLLRRLVSEVAGTDLAVSRLAARPTGQPFLATRPGIGVSLSHTDGWVAAAVYLRGQTGVDVQAPALAPGRLRRRCCTPSALRALSALPRAERDLEFARIWSVQESCVKATGRGIAGMPWTIPVEVGQATGNWGDVRWSAPCRALPVGLSCAYLPGLRGRSCARPAAQARPFTAAGADTGANRLAAGERMIAYRTNATAKGGALGAGGARTSRCKGVWLSSSSPMR